MSRYLCVDSTNCSGFRKYGCGFRKFAYFWSSFERYTLKGVFFVESKTAKQQGRSKKSNNLIWARQILFGPLVESTCNAQNAQFGLVMLEKIGSQVHLYKPNGLKRCDCFFHSYETVCNLNESKCDRYVSAFLGVCFDMFRLCLQYVLNLFSTQIFSRTFFIGRAPRCA